MSSSFSDFDHSPPIKFTTKLYMKIRTKHSSTSVAISEIPDVRSSQTILPSDASIDELGATLNGIYRRVSALPLIPIVKKNSGRVRESTVPTKIDYFDLGHSKAIISASLPALGNGNVAYRYFEINLDTVHLLPLVVRSSNGFIPYSPLSSKVTPTLKQYSFNSTYHQSKLNPKYHSNSNTSSPSHPQGSQNYYKNIVGEDFQFPGANNLPNKTKPTSSVSSSSISSNTSKSSITSSGLSQDWRLTQSAHDRSNSGPSRSSTRQLTEAEKLSASVTSPQAVILGPDGKQLWASDNKNDKNSRGLISSDEDYINHHLYSIAATDSTSNTKTQTTNQGDQKGSRNDHSVPQFPDALAENPTQTTVHNPSGSSKTTDNNNNELVLEQPSNTPPSTAASNSADKSASTGTMKVNGETNGSINQQDILLNHKDAEQDHEKENAETFVTQKDSPSLQQESLSSHDNPERSQDSTINSEDTSSNNGSTKDTASSANLTKLVIPDYSASEPSTPKCGTPTSTASSTSSTYSGFSTNRDILDGVEYMAIDTAYISPANWDITSHCFNSLATDSTKYNCTLGARGGDIFLVETKEGKVFKCINSKGCFVPRAVQKTAWISPEEMLVSFADGFLYIIHTDCIDDANFVSENFDPRLSKNRKKSTTSVTTLPSPQANGTAHPTTPPHSNVKHDGWITEWLWRRIFPRHGKPLNPVGVWQVCPGFQITDFAVSPDFRYLATTSTDGMLRIFCMQESSLQVTFKSFYGGFNCLTWSPDSLYVATGGEDDLVSLWSIADKSLVARGMGHIGFVTKIAFDAHRCETKTYYRFASVGHDCRIIIWEFSYDTLVVPNVRPSRRLSISKPSTNTGGGTGGNKDSSSGSPSAPVFVPPLPRENTCMLEPLVNQEATTSPCSDVAFLGPNLLLVGGWAGQLAFYMFESQPRPPVKVDLFGDSYVFEH